MLGDCERDIYDTELERVFVAMLFMLHQNKAQEADQELYEAQLETERKSKQQKVKK